MTVWTCPCFTFRNSWNFVFFVLVCIFNLKIIFSLCLLPLVRGIAKTSIICSLVFGVFCMPVPRSDRQRIGLSSSMAAHQLSVIWGIAHSEVWCHGTEEGELILFSLAGLFLEGCSQLEAPHYKSAGTSWRDFTGDPQECLQDHRGWLMRKEYKWNQDSRSIQLCKYLRNINLMGEGSSLWCGLGWEKKSKSKIKTV